MVSSALGQPTGRITGVTMLSQAIIHLAFTASALGIARVDRMTHQKN